MCFFLIFEEIAKKMFQQPLDLTVFFSNSTPKKMYCHPIQDPLAISYCFFLKSHKMSRFHEFIIRGEIRKILECTGKYKEIADVWGHRGNIQRDIRM